MSSMMLALAGVKLYSPNSFPSLQMTPLILPKRTFRVMLLPMMILANNDCAIDRTGSSSKQLKAVDLSIGFC